MPISSTPISNGELKSILEGLTPKDVHCLEKLIRYPLPIDDRLASGLCQRNNQILKENYITIEDNTNKKIVEIYQDYEVKKTSGVTYNYHIVVALKSNPTKPIFHAVLESTALTNLLEEIKANKKEKHPKLPFDFLKIM